MGSGSRQVPARSASAGPLDESGGVPRIDQMTPGSARAAHLTAGEKHARDLSKPLPSALSWTILCAFGVTLPVVYVIADLPLWIPMVYLVMSITAFAAYGVDKAAAKADRRRTSEQMLLTLGLVGGWPGALLAQQVFRHKTRKRSFRRAFWFTVVLNTAVLAGLVYLVTTTPGVLDLPFIATRGLA